MGREVGGGFRMGNTCIPVALKHVYIICETNRQSRFDAWYRMLGAGALG